MLWGIAYHIGDVLGVGAGSFDKLRMNGGAYQDEWGANHDERGRITMQGGRALRRERGIVALGRWQFWRGVVRLRGLDFLRGRRLADGVDGFGD